MPVVSKAAPSSPPPALSAFLRGVERRGAVLAELQCGDATTGDAALVEAMRAFHRGAAGVPMAEWPCRFWTMLLAEPALRQRVAVALPLDATDRLGDVPTGPRAALLLRLAAGLAETEAAEVLGVGVASYRMALRGALPHHADGRADPQAWQHLRDQVHRRIKALAPSRLQHLALAREALLRGEVTPAPGTAPAVDGTVRGVRPRWLMPLLWGLLLLCLVAFAATWWWPWRGLGAGRGADARVEPLPPAEVPLATLPAEAMLVAHPDFALLAEAESDADDLAFRAWLAAVEAGLVTADGPALASDEPLAVPRTALPDAALPPLESAGEEDRSAMP